MTLYRAEVVTVVYFFAEDELAARLDVGEYARQERGSVRARIEEVKAGHEIDPGWDAAIPYGKPSDGEEHSVARRVADL